MRITNTTNLLENSRTRVWVETPVHEGSIRTYGTKVVAEAVIVNPRSIIAVIRERLTTFPGNDSVILGTFAEGHIIYVTYCEAGRPDRFANNEPILTMRSCEIVARFVDPLGAMEPVESNIAEAILLAESWDYTWRKKE